MYTLKRGDGLVRTSEDVKWIEFDEIGRGKETHDKPAVGLSLIMSPFNMYYTWMTTLVTEILEESDNYIKFKTQNSDYELIKEDNGLDK